MSPTLGRAGESDVMWRRQVGSVAPAPVVVPAAAPAELPATMRAGAIDARGGPEALTLHTLALPKPAPGEVLIALHAAGVASWDVGIRRHPPDLKNSRL